MNIKKSLFSLSLLTSISLAVFSQESINNSTWEGKIMNIRLVLKIREDATTKQAVAVFDSPDQGAFGLKVSELKISKDSLTAFSGQIRAGFSGAFSPDRQQIVGSWNQGGAIPFTFHRIENPEELRRPQTPKAPFPYTEEKIIYHNKDKSIQYGATLTRPNMQSKAPVVLLISGSGQQDRDESLFGHKPFWVIADYLSRNGIAVLRVDDRGVGETTGEVMTATSLDFSNDVLVGVDYLKNRADIDATRIGLLGHSEGGIIAPLAALKSKDIAYIVSLAGLGITGRELLLKQSDLLSKQLDLTAEEQKVMLSLNNMLMDLGQKYPDNNELKEIFAQKFEAWRSQQTDTLLVKTGFKGPKADENINAMAARFFLPWMRYFVQYDPATTLTKLKIPVLALNGEKDIQVSAKENLAGFNKYLTAAGNKNFKTQAFPDLNHLFQHAETGSISEYQQIEETIAPEVLLTIVNWIKSLK